MSTVAIIPARGGSKGLPRKNLRLLGGEPLVVHTVRAALAARRVDRVLVSTDDAAIARAARRAGADVPFRRPPELATDHAATLPVVQHAVAWLEDHGQRVDVVVTLQPTSPLRGPAEIDAVVALLDGGDARSAVSVALLGVPAAAVGWLERDRFAFAAPSAPDARRQAAPPAARLTGGVYATRRDLLGEGRLVDDRPRAHVVGGAASIDVDSADDLRAARRAWRAVAR